MQRFIEACASYIIQKSGDSLSEICIVLPNHRSGIFFTAYLKKQLEKPVIGPKITTINELMLSFSDLFPADRLHLIALLYETYREITGSGESFDEFYFWGEVLLADFDDIDKYLVNAADLFKNISSLKDIEHQFDYLSEEQKKLLVQFWGSLSNWERYHHEKNFITIWEKLFAIYSGFRAKLSEEGIGYPGMIMRNNIETLEEGKIQLPYKKYLFIGLNALNSCEKKLFAKLKEINRAVFFWDYDRYYLGNRINNAGRFIRENLQLFPAPQDFDHDTGQFTQPKTIRLVAVASNAGQAQVIPRYLDNKRKEETGSFDNTAIVLADESLLFPVLGAIPAEAGPVNVTMGYPVKNSPVVSLIQQTASLIRNTSQGENGEPVMYYKQVTDILSHQLLRETEPEKTIAKIHEIKSNNKLYITPSELDFSELHRRIFSLPARVDDYATYFLGMLELLFEKNGGKDGDQVMREIIYTIYLAFEKIQVLIARLTKKGNVEISPAVFFRVMTQHLNQVIVPFEGEPLSGLQVMGILETRCLDFDKLIIIGLNEDIWPRTSMAPSLIPFNLRKGFGLPGIDDQDAMYSYYFYRLIQRAKSITATWSTIRELISGGELSRFGFQLMLHSPHPVISQSFDFAFYNNAPGPVSVTSSAAMVDQLLQANHSGKALSPSALNSYLLCSLKFYFRYVAGLKEPDEVSEDIDRQVFGILLHKALENLYDPYTCKTLGKSDFSKLTADKAGIKKAILQAFTTEYFKKPKEEWEKLPIGGKSLLILSTLESYIRNLLETDRESAPLFIHALEKEFETCLEVEADGWVRKIRIGGKVDRVDEINGVIRVIDYKTGSLNAYDLQFKSFEELFDRTKKNLKKEIIQSLVYSCILKRDYYPEKTVQAVVYSVINLKNESFDPAVRMNNQAYEMPDPGSELEKYLKAVLQEIYSRETVFSQTEFTDRCVYCPYQAICRR